MTKQEQIHSIVNKIVSQANPEKVILFGSYAWGKPNRDSDVDLLVVEKSDKGRLERGIKLREAIFPAGVAVDIISYTPEELELAVNEHRNLFLEDIVRNGQVLYEKPNFSINIFRKPAELLTI
jgi:predicted nucleotidyltransferase